MTPTNDYIKIIERKIKTIDEIISVKSSLHTERKLIAFTNGCFDILHRGHIEYLAKAAHLADYLIVGVNSDNSVKRQNKSPERPINNQETRCINLGALFFVDAVIVFDEDNPLKLIQSIVPDILIKGGDYNENETDPLSKKYIVGSDVVKATGGKVITIPLVEGFSTTSIVSKLKMN